MEKTNGNLCLEAKLSTVGVKYPYKTTKIEEKAHQIDTIDIQESLILPDYCDFPYSCQECHDGNVEYVDVPMFD